MTSRNLPFEYVATLSAPARAVLDEVLCFEASDFPSRRKGVVKISLRFGGCHLCIASDLPEVIEGLRGRFYCESSFASTSKDQHIEILLRDTATRTLSIHSLYRLLITRLSDDTKAFFGSLDRRTLHILAGSWSGSGYEHIMHAIVDHEILNVYCKSLDALSIIHGNAISKDGSNVVLVGPSMSGKTMLSLGLSARGARWLSDDLCGIELGSGELHAFPRRPTIRESALRALSDAIPAEELSHLVRDLRDGLSYNHGHDCDATRRIHSFVFLIGFGESVVMNRLKTIEAVSLFLANAIVDQNDQLSDVVSRTFHALDSIKCFTLRIGNCKDTVASLEELLKSRRPYP